MYGVKQSTTMPYNPCGNSQCEWFNHTLFGLMRTLKCEQKPNWPTYLPSLVFAYNATPHTSTGLQTYELMFRHKAPMPCDNWLQNYKPYSFKSKTVWLNQQLNAMLFANKQVLKLINQSTKHNKDHTGSRLLHIPIGNHVLLGDHQEGCNKIQDQYKSDIYIVVGHHSEPNVYYIQLLNKDKPGPLKVVNWQQLFNLNRSEPPSVASTSFNGDSTAVPSFLHPKSKLNTYNSNSNNNTSHHYNTKSKHKAATAGRQVEVNTIITYL